MSNNTITVAPGDGGLLFSKDGKVQLIVPEGNSADTLKVSQLLLGIAEALKNPEMVELFFKLSGTAK